MSTPILQSCPHGLNLRTNQESVVLSNHSFQNNRDVSGYWCKCFVTLVFAIWLIWGHSWENTPYLTISSVWGCDFFSSLRFYFHSALNSYMSSRNSVIGTSFKFTTLLRFILFIWIYAFLSPHVWLLLPQLPSYPKKVIFKVILPYVGNCVMKHSFLTVSVKISIIFLGII